MSSAFDEALKRPLMPPSSASSTSSSSTRSSQTRKGDDVMRGRHTSISRLPPQKNSRSPYIPPSSSSVSSSSSPLVFPDVPMNANHPRPARPTSSSNPFDDEEDVEVGGGLSGVGRSQMQTKKGMQSMDMDHALLRERHEEMEQVATKMNQIRDISQDLATLVDEQQDDFDMIEHNTEETHERAQRGLSDVQKSLGFMKRTSGMGRIVLGLLVVLLFGSVMAAWVTFGIHL